MSSALKVATIQHRLRDSAAGTLDYLADQIAQSTREGARLIVLQELHNSAYFCQTESVAHFDLAETIPGPSTERLGGLAKQYDCVIVSSLFERRAAGLYHNTAVVLERDGSIAGTFRKMHIPDDPGFYEKFYFTPGDADPDKRNGFAPVETSLGKLGVLVCWDQWYPEAARLMALAGAELLIYPTAIGWDPGDDQDEQERQLDAWMTIQRAHGVANGLPVIVCNRTGFEASPASDAEGTQFWGNSFVCGPQGELLARASMDKEEILFADIDLARCENVRRIWPYLRDRRIDAYSNLTRRYLD